MPSRRGEVVLVRYPNSDLLSFKKRPALVVQANDLETGLPQCIVAAITSNLRRVGPTRVTVAGDGAIGREMALLTDSVVMTDNLATVLDREIDKIIGRCPAMDDIEVALRRTLGM